MKAAERRKAIAELLASRKEPVTGAALAEQFDISRQIIVQDVTVLKGMGYEILSTKNGYILQRSPLVERVFKVRHTSAETEDELSCIVSRGGTVVDVFVWHKVYGKITAPLHIFSDYQIKQFLEGVRSGRSSELMHITDGYHYHTVRAESEEILDEIARALDARAYTVPELS